MPIDHKVNETCPKPASTSKLKGRSHPFAFLRHPTGRTVPLSSDEAGHNVVILEHQFWKQQFGGDPGIIGRTITLNNRAYTVVGVMPAGFEFPLQRKPVSVWTTFSADQSTDDNTPPITKQRGAHWFHVIARLKPGVSIAQAQAAMDVITAGLAKQFPDPINTSESSWNPNATGLQARSVRRCSC